MTAKDKRIAETMRELGKVVFDLANELDPPYPCGPYEKPFTCVGGGGWPPFTDTNGVGHPGCQEVCESYLKWKATQEEE